MLSWKDILVVKLRHNELLEDAEMYRLIKSIEMVGRKRKRAVLSHLMLWLARLLHVFKLVVVGEHDRAPELTLRRFRTCAKVDCRVKFVGTT